MIRRINVRSLAVLAAFLSCTASASVAAVELPTIFGSYMVLQSGMRAPIWGSAAPGERVTVTFAGQSQVAEAGPDGGWRVELDPLEASGEGRALTVTGTNTIVLEDVLVGEVWLCSGQSIMFLGVASADDADLELLDSDHPRLRLIRVLSDPADDPQIAFEGRWQPSWPSSAAEFSAICFFFGRELHRILDVPVGLIQSAAHSSSCEAWIGRPTLEADPRFRGLLERWDESDADFARVQAGKGSTEGGQPAATAGGNAHRQAPSGYGAERDPRLSPRRPGSLYNSLIHPILGYGIRGVLWYQGESNVQEPDLYRDLFPTLIRDWRRKWGRDDLPFYWVQLPAFGVESPERTDRVPIREAQALVAREIPHTAQVVTIDLDGPLHPKNKQVFARRLLRLALALEYGRDVSYRNPTYRSMERRDGALSLTFADVGSGLTAGAPLVRGFSVAGDDRKFLPAKARIADDDQVIVWNLKVPQPVAVRYGWANNPGCNLFSKEGLPVAPFRTDDYD